MIAARRVAAVLVGLGCAGCTPAQPTPPAVRAQALYTAGIDRFTARLDALLATAAAHPRDGAALRGSFERARLAFKRVEPLAEYYAPSTARQLNGPPVDEYEEGEGPFAVHAEGFQVLEPLLYPTLAADSATLVEHARELRANAARLRQVAEVTPLSDANVFDAARLELLRVLALGLSGYDSPLARRSVPEAREALLGLQALLRGYAAPDDGAAAPAQWALDARFDDAVAALERSGDFDRFDRLRFLADGLLPMHAALDRVRVARGIALPELPAAWRAGAPTPYEPGAFDATFFSPHPGRPAPQALVELGRDLFRDSTLSGTGRRACASCHRPDRSFADGLARSAALDGGALERNTPTVLNAALQLGTFQDMRTTYLEDQARAVLASPREMGSSSAEAARRLARSPAHAKRFADAFERAPGPVEAHEVEAALAAYVRSLVTLDSPFDAYLRGDRGALTEAQRRGFNTYMGKAKCGTCHFAPLFNGAVPPAFDRTEIEVLGVPTRPDTARARLDPDEGRWRVDRSPLHRYAFRTPTLRNVERTAPYMHNGAYATLEQVIDFYDRGGGAGIGVELEQQTLPPERLHLTEREKADLVEFMKALSDRSVR